jgi:hypothetical protein
MDKMHRTNRKPDIMAYDVYHQTKWAEMKEENSEQAKKWMGRHQTEFTEVE